MRKLLARSDRVKSVDFHPTEPHVICGLYNGQVKIWNYETQTDLKTFEVTDVPVRCVRYIARKNWFVSGSDDFQLRVYNISTGERVTSFEAHPDYIRCMTVHPTLSLVLTGSDDMTIKAWDWDKGWRCVQTFEGHTHYIMSLAFNPKDPQTFASACLDHTVKVWSLGSSVANYSLEAHEKGVNYVEYYHGGDRPYMVTTGDDRTVKIWDYQNKSCVQTLEGHSANVSFAIFHPSLPIIISGSEDGTVKIWHSSTYRLETTLSYGLERCWCIAYRKNGNEVAIGYDEGAVVVKLGREEPSVSMDVSGKVVYAKNTEILTANIQSVADETITDGQRLAIPVRELGATEIFPQSLQHSPNGRFVTVCGDGEYIIYTALAWRNKAFGSGTSFAWATDSNTYAVLEGKSKIRAFRNFKERPGLIKGASGLIFDAVYGGALLAARGNGFVIFWDWETGAIVRRIEVDATSVSWSTTGTLVAIASTDSLFLLRFDRDAYNARLDSGIEIGDEGVEEAFDLVTELNENVKTTKWIGDCLIYTNSANRLNYIVGEQAHTINHFDQNMYLLGYLPAHNRVYVADKDMNIFSYALSLIVVEYQTAILRGDMDLANEILPTVPQSERNRIARFLEAQDMKELALQVATDPDQQFDLAIQLDDLDKALELARASPDGGAEMKWRTVGDKALAAWRMDLAQECFERAGDLSALLLIYSSLGDKDGMQKLANLALEKGQNNVAFNCFFQTGDVASCIDVLIKTDRAPEAALFARTYAPSAVPATVKTWKHALGASGKQKIAQTLADPEDGDEELFEEGWADALRREQNGGQSAESARPPNGETGYSVEDGETTPKTEQEPSKVTEVIENLVDKAKELVVGDDSQEPEAEPPVDESTEAEVADEESKTEETADTAPAAPTKSKNKKNKNK
ncbi:hypothetical protein QFC20_004197 [Naganishia adeliensis]|uniref:Uncharacterized protein n=1 Tax=Naganishia adeliensis TaxID=92952 RepID=A0ACC2W2M7_9TREE|nr:hypothetical protein QFC20_004197 [Naganishia adeliensis]